RRMKKTDWTNEEDEYINENYATESTKTIAEKLNRTVFAVRARASRLFVSKDYLFAVYQNDETIIGTASEIAKSLGVKKTTIFNYASPRRRKKDKNKSIVNAERLGGE